jgi:hypothetical protein
MTNDNGSIKARMFVGGLKSLFVDMAETLEQVEKTGTMPLDMLQSLLDIKSAIDMTLIQLSKTQMRCCEHAPECVHSEEKVCEECQEVVEECLCEEEEEEEEDICEECEEFVQDCVCEEEEVAPVKKPTAKVVTVNSKKRKH